LFQITDRSRFAISLRSYEHIGKDSVDELSSSCKENPSRESDISGLETQCYTADMTVLAQSSDDG
jgi:hypothetical protein